MLDDRILFSEISSGESYFSFLVGCTFLRRSGSCVVFVLFLSNVSLNSHYPKEKNVVYFIIVVFFFKVSDNVNTL